MTRARRGSFMDWSMVRAELRLARTPPYDVVRAVLVNGSMMTVAWFTLPRAWLFSVTGPAMFPLILASWMYSDPLVTNVLRPGHAALRELRSAESPVPGVVQALRVQALVLWSSVTLPCLVAAVLLGLGERRPLESAAVALGVVLLPVGPVVLAGCLGLAFPYQPRPWRWRWARRRERGQQLRWAALAGAPYLLVPCLLGLTTTPSVLWLRRMRVLPGATRPDLDLAWLVGLACATSVAMAVVGDALTRTLLRRRRAALVALTVGWSEEDTTRTS